MRKSNIENLFVEVSVYVHVLIETKREQNEKNLSGSMHIIKFETTTTNK